MNEELGIKNAKIKNFTDLLVWQEGHKLVLDIYIVTKNFPAGELYGLTNQLCRAIVSFTSNIAEGFSRFTYKDKLKFYIISAGSLTEVQNQLLIARDVSYLSKIDFDRLSAQSIQVSKLINGLIKKTKSIS